MLVDNRGTDNRSPGDQELYVFGPFVLDPLLRVLRRQAEIVPLTAKELDILLALVRNAGEGLSREKLQSLVWGGEIGDSTLPTHIRNLRKKLRKDENGGEFIIAESGKGYRLAALVTRERRAARPPEALESLDSPQDPLTGISTVSATPPPQRGLLARRVTLVTLAFVASVAAVVLAIKLLPAGVFNPAVATLPRIGRLLSRATSEGSRPRQVSLSHRPTYLAISPRGDKVFAADSLGRTLSILSTANNSVRTLALPQDAASLAVSPDGKLYIGSQVDGLMVLKIDSAQLLPSIPTGGPVMGMAITPDGSQLFLAMSMKGLKRLSTRSAKLTQISDRICPEYLAIDGQGKRLYIAYQCSGPTGWPGHDSVGIFDVEKETSLGFVSGPPMVGGQPSVSPDGKLVLLDGLDACWSPQYDHRGCKSVPSDVFHLLDPLGRQILHSFEFSRHSGHARFLDNSRFLLFGDSVSVVDAASYSVLERWNNAEDCGATDIVLAPDGRPAYLGCAQNNTIRVLQPESAACSPPQQGIAMYYAADGTTEDSAGLAALTPDGNPRFAAGKVGQAFFLDGSSYLSTSWTGYYRFGLRNSTLALYVKFAGIGGEMALADWTDENPRRGIRLLKSAGNRFVFQEWPDSSPLESQTVVRPDIWYHIVVTKTGRDLTLYVNGKPESHGTPPPPFNQLPQPRLFLGARSPGQPSFHGWLDEIAFYNRALTAEEVRDLYQLRESGPCKL